MKGGNFQRSMSQHFNVYFPKINLPSKILSQNNFVLNTAKLSIQNFFQRSSLCKKFELSNFLLPMTYAVMADNLCQGNLCSYSIFKIRSFPNCQNFFFLIGNLIQLIFKQNFVVLEFQKIERE